MLARLEKVPSTLAEQRAAVAVLMAVHRQDSSHNIQDLKMALLTGFADHLVPILSACSRDKFPDVKIQTSKCVGRTFGLVNADGVRSSITKLATILPPYARNTNEKKTEKSQGLSPLAS